MKYIGFQEVEPSQILFKTNKPGGSDNLSMRF